ncbi:MAG: head-tail connector protein [Candidatus Aminicenantes bacterium]|nr:head-tail connector protein [Candidatus Aminicenantes bacterium]
MAVVSLEEAKAYLKVDTTDDDMLIASLISVAEATIEKFTGRKLLTSEFAYMLDMAGDIILIPYSPLQEITKIETVASSGAVTDVSSEIYEVDISRDQVGRIRLKPGNSWPDHRCFASFIIRGRAGYGDTPDKVPSPLKVAILVALAILYENRGAVESQKLQDAISALCWPYRVLRI